jgi:hypothetical protein
VLLNVLVRHNLGEYIAGLLTGYSPESSLFTEDVATAKLVGGDYAWLFHVRVKCITRADGGMDPG